MIFLKYCTSARLRYIKKLYTISCFWAHTYALTSALSVSLNFIIKKIIQLIKKYFQSCPQHGSVVVVRFSE